MMLKFDSRNIDSKNHDSQTAAHIASYYGHTEVREDIKNCKIWGFCH